jgi:hypothetical protein
MAANPRRLRLELLDWLLLPLLRLLLLVAITSSLSP